MANGRKRILIADDEPMVRDLLVDSLRDAGFEVLEASSGDEAAQLLVDPDNVQAVVTDMQMPGTLDGNGVAKAAKAVHPDMPVIVMTGNPSSLKITLGRNDILLRKPFAPWEVVEAVRRLLGSA